MKPVVSPFSPGILPMEKLIDNFDASWDVSALMDEAKSLLESGMHIIGLFSSLSSSVPPSLLNIVYLQPRHLVHNEDRL